MIDFDKPSMRKAINKHHKYHSLCIKMEKKRALKKLKTAEFTTATEIVAHYRDKAMESLMKKHHTKIMIAYNQLVLKLQKQGIMPGMYWVDHRFENNKITLIARLK